MTDSRSNREYSTDEIIRLLQQIAEEKSASPPVAAPTQPRSKSAAVVTRELSLDEILQKIQHEIAQGQPTPSREG